MKYRLGVLAALFLGLVCVGAAHAERLTTATGYALSYEVYKAPGPAALIFMHGKNGMNGTPGMKALAEKISKAGFTVYLPLMPWSRNWDGTAADATSAIDALIDSAAKDGKKVFLGGQSMGAMFTIAYRAGELPPAVIGKVLTSPGALLDLTPPNSPAMKAIAPSVEKAKALETEGKAKEKAQFVSTNTEGEKSVEETYTTTPEIFLSFHDVARAPSVKKGLAQNSVPVFWSAGLKDPVGNNKKRSFELMPANPASLYLETNGNHNTNMVISIDPIIDWMKARAAN